jgi:hypothetical protein
MSVWPRRRGVILAAMGWALSGCAIVPTFHAEATRAAVAADHVLLVGRIDLIPPLGADEQKLRIGGIDPADVRGKLHRRAVFFLDDAVATSRRQTASVMNPVLGEWFVVSIPRTQRFVTDAAVFMAYEPLLYGRRQAVVNTAQLMLPALFAWDIRPGDQALYVGSWRVWRDEFHQVTRFEVVDDLAGASAASADVRITSASAHIAAKGSRSPARKARRRSRAVVISGAAARLMAPGASPGNAPSPRRTRSGSPRWRSRGLRCP